jgi:signal transduction histidine kinase
MNWPGFKRLFTPPVFPEDEEKTRVARLLHIILWTSLLVVGAVTLATPFVEPEPLLSFSFALLGSFALVIAGTLVLVRRGRIFLASIVFLSVVWLMLSFSAFAFGGVNGSSFSAYLVVILIAGLLLGGRASIGFAVLSGFAGLGLLYAEASGILQPPASMSSFSTSLHRWVGEMTSFIMAAVLLHLATRSIREALERARRNERAQLEANRELSLLSASLEQRVGERTLELQASHTDLQQAYETLQAHQAKLMVAEKMTSLGRLTAGIAHEMNTPLAAIRGALAGLNELAKEYESSIDEPSVTSDDHRAIAREMQEVIQLGEKATERAAEFVQGIKSQTRSVDTLTAEYFDAGLVIQDALVLLGYALRYAKCVESFEAGAKRVELYGSPGRLTHIVTNLVTNAIEASAAQGGGPINLSLIPGPEGVELKISDAGRGIPPEVLPKIFDPMFTTKPFGEGTGLGLTIVHDIVTSEFGGTIDVESQIGVGTTFTIWFPKRFEM